MVIKTDLNQTGKAFCLLKNMLPTSAWVPQLSLLRLVADLPLLYIVSFDSWARKGPQEALLSHHLLKAPRSRSGSKCSAVTQDLAAQR